MLMYGNPLTTFKKYPDKTILILRKTKHKAH